MGRYAGRVAIDAHLAQRYGSPEGARAYRGKYRRSLLRRLSNVRELFVVRAAVAQAGGQGRLLDCPCGAGRLTPVLLETAEHVTGADLSAAMIAQASDALRAPLASGRVDLCVASADALPFPDGAFDLVVCHRLIHHVGDAGARARILAELSRVARRAVVLSFNDATTPKMRWQLRRRRPRRRVAWTPEALAREAAPHGLVLEPPVRRLAGWFSLVAVGVLRRRG